MSRLGRFNQTLLMDQGRGAPVLLHGAPIKALPYMKNMKWGKLGTPEEAIAKAEFSRMLQIYDLANAIQQPLRYRDKHVVWEVRFPPGAKWKSGPEAGSAYYAMMDNYIRNNRFAGYMPLAQMTEDNLASLQRTVDDSLAKDRKRNEEFLKEQNDRHVP